MAFGTDAHGPLKVATEREELVNLNPAARRPRRRDGGILFAERPFRPGILKVGTRREQPLSRLLPLRPPWHWQAALPLRPGGAAPEAHLHRAEKSLESWVLIEVEVRSGQVRSGQVCHSAEV